jgi:hypothetical protein
MKDAVDQRVDIMFSPSYDGRTSYYTVTDLNGMACEGAYWFSMAQDRFSGWLLWTQ